MEFLDNRTETPTGLVKEFKTGILCFWFILFVAFMDRGVPKFPIMKKEHSIVSIGTYTPNPGRALKAKGSGTNHCSIDLNSEGWKV